MFSGKYNYFNKDEGVKMKWSCGHEGYVNLDWLRRHCYSNHSLDKRHKGCIPLLSQQVYTLLCLVQRNDSENDTLMLFSIF